MATPSEKLTNSLEALHRVQQDGKIAIRSSDLSRTHRERLIKNGFLEEVMKGWYIILGHVGAGGGRGCTRTKNSHIAARLTKYKETQRKVYVEAWLLLRA